MNKKAKLQELYRKLGALQDKRMGSDSIDTLIKEEVADLTSKLAENPTVKILKKFSGELAQFKKELDLTPITELIQEVEKEITGNQQAMAQEFETKLTSMVGDVYKAIPKMPDMPKPFDPSNLVKDITKLREDFTGKKDFDSTPLTKELDALKKRLEGMAEEAKKDTSKEDNKKDFDEKLKELRRDLINIINNKGGGNMNRQVLFNGVNRLTKYTDYDIRPGTNVSFTVTENNVAKRVTLTINATGGSGSGITRLIESVAVNTAAGESATTDYVYLVSGTTTITLPTAVGNTNLYTIKNVGTGVVTINTTGGETIDNDSTVVMPIRYTSVDIISNTTNWNIT